MKGFSKYDVFGNVLDRLESTVKYERGVNCPGLEFGLPVFPGTINSDFFLPKESLIAYLSSKGFTFVRLPFRWERLQPNLNEDLDQTYKGYLDSSIELAKKYKMKIILDCQNNGRRYISGVEYLIGSEEVPLSSFVDLWKRIAHAYCYEDGIIGYDLMNEPHDMIIPQTPQNYNPLAPCTQVVKNTLFEGASTSGYSLDGSYSLTMENSYSGQYSIKLVGTDGNYDNFTTENSSNGIPVKPNTQYVFSIYSQSKIYGNYPNIQINSGSAYGTTLASGSIEPSDNFTRLTIEFTTGSSDNMVWMRLFNNGSSGTAYFDAINVTEGVDVKNFTPILYDGSPIATTSQLNQDTIDAIRENDTQHIIFIESDNWSGLWAFTQNFGTHPAIWWNDPYDKTMLSFHYYNDATHSGDFSTEWVQNLRDRISSDMLPALNWAKANNQQLYISEYGCPGGNTTSDQNYQEDLDTILGYLDEYNCYGSYWATSPNGVAGLTDINPSGLSDKPQIAILQKHLGVYNIKSLKDYLNKKIQTS